MPEKKTAKKDVLASATRTAARKTSTASPPTNELR